ncbi:relaxase/mobilization nuclease domain-containing protein [Rhizobium ruizarguesonis]
MVSQAIVHVVRGGGAHTIGRICSQWNYLTRKGRLQLQFSERHGGGFMPQGEFPEWARRWADEAGNYVDGRLVGDPQQDMTTHIVVSFPPGTDHDAARRAGRRWSEDMFGSDGQAGEFDYVTAFHIDQEHPHMHVIVNRRSLSAGHEWLKIARRNERINYDLMRARLVLAARLEGIHLRADARVPRGNSNWSATREQFVDGVRHAVAVEEHWEDQRMDQEEVRVLEVDERPADVRDDAARAPAASSPTSSSRPSPPGSHQGGPGGGSGDDEDIYDATPPRRAATPQGGHTSNTSHPGSAWGDRVPDHQIYDATPRASPEPPFESTPAGGSGSQGGVSPEPQQLDAAAARTPDPGTPRPSADGGQPDRVRHSGSGGRSGMQGGMAPPGGGADDEQARRAAESEEVRTRRRAERRGEDGGVQTHRAEEEGRRIEDGAVSDRTRGVKRDHTGAPVPERGQREATDPPIDAQRSEEAALSRSEKRRAERRARQAEELTADGIEAAGETAQEREERLAAARARRHGDDVDRVVRTRAQERAERARQIEEGPVSGRLRSGKRDRDSTR